MADNPKDQKYLKICFVCTEEAKPGKEHLKNYGGIVCFSCRAFWRRSHQATKNPVLFCKRNGDCELNTESRRHCKKCRYQRCLLAGMKPEAVLDTQQKKIHFRKYYSKQERLSKVKRRKCMKKEEAKLSRSRNDPKNRPPQQPRHKIVKIEQRTPERRDLDADGTLFNNFYQSANMYGKENNPVGFNSWENSCPSSFSNPAYQHCSYDFSYGNMTRALPQQEYGQSSIQLPDLDDIHTEALFFWNSMDFAN